MAGKCPRCGKTYNDYPSLSRRANVDICSDCGLDEAMRDFLGMPAMKFDDWYQHPTGVA